jgi:DNA-binding NarL/FixJ family response regulator
MGKRQILLADDHAIVRAGIRKIVEEIPGLEVVAEVGSGPELLQHLNQLTLDLILIDLRMPDFDPLTTIPQIRARYPAMKILVVSAHNDDVYVQGLLVAGVDGYHLKDQPLSDLKLAIERVLAGERWISSPLIRQLIDPTQANVPAAVSQAGHSGGPMLTMRQKDLLRLLLEGYDNQKIAQEMGLSVKTVENHLTRLYRQLGVQSRLEAAKYAGQRPELLGVSGQTISQAPVDANQPKGIAILLVDDNIRYMRQLQRVLGKAYPQAILFEAEDIATAVQIAQNVHPALVFIDVVLGEEDGIRCTRRIKAISPQSRVVTISAYPDREFHRLSLEAGAVAFLDKKDLDAVTLHQVVDDVIS